MNKLFLSVSAIVSISLLSIHSFAASFDCAKASSVTEKLICGDEKLFALDEQLASSYKKALEAAEDKEAVKKAQIEWLKGQRACKDMGCLTKAYQARTGELNGKEAITESTSAATKELTYKTGYKRVDIRKAFPDGYSIKNVRPANMFQIAASINDKLCGDVLSVLNQPGNYQGPDEIYWWVSNPNLVKWNVVKKGYEDGYGTYAPENYLPMQVEEFIGDIDRDGILDHAYRVGISVHGYVSQDIAFFSSDLKTDNSMDKSFIDGTCQFAPKAVCEESRLNWAKTSVDGRIMAFVSALSDAPLEKKWKSMTQDSMFIKGFSSSYWDYEGHWLFSTLLNVDKVYGYIAYPFNNNNLELFYGSISKVDPIKYQCIFAPKITQH